MTYTPTQTLASLDKKAPDYIRRPVRQEPECPRLKRGDWVTFRFRDNDRGPWDRDGQALLKYRGATVIDYDPTTGRACLWVYLVAGTDFGDGGTYATRDHLNISNVPFWRTGMLEDGTWEL